MILQTKTFSQACQEENSIFDRKKNSFSKENLKKKKISTSVADRIGEENIFSLVKTIESTFYFIFFG